MYMPSGSAALFIDLENIRYALINDHNRDLDAPTLITRALGYGCLVHASAYADRTRQPQDILDGLAASSIDLVHVPLNGAGKSRADSAIMLDALELALSRPDITDYIFATGDFDFVSIVERLRRYGKRVIVVGVPGSTSRALMESADLAELLPVTPDIDLGRRAMNRDEQSVIRLLLWIDARWQNRSLYSIAHYMTSDRRPAARAYSLPEAQDMLRMLLDGGVLQDVGDPAMKEHGTLILNQMHPWVREVRRTWKETSRPAVTGSAAPASALSLGMATRDAVGRMRLAAQVA